MVIFRNNSNETKANVATNIHKNDSDKSTKNTVNTATAETFNTFGAKTNMRLQDAVKSTAKKEPKKAENNSKNQENSGKFYGTLLVKAVTARGALPVKNASISVLKDGKTVGKTVTDENGNSAILTLSAPSNKLSTTPGVPKPFATYDIVTTHPQYSLEIVKNAQVFAEELTLQVAELLPLPINANAKEKVEQFLVLPQNL